jgi:hypothetical protein
MSMCLYIVFSLWLDGSFMLVACFHENGLNIVNFSFGFHHIQLNEKTAAGRSRFERKTWQELGGGAWSILTDWDYDWDWD